MTGEVISVLGPIAPEEMGITQTHEHLLLDAYDHYGGYEFRLSKSWKSSQVAAAKRSAR